MLVTTVFAMVAFALHLGDWKEVVRRCRQIVIRRHESGAAGHDAMTVMIRVAGKGNIKFILQSDEALHGVGEEGSMRILPSQSSVMNRKVGSTASLVTVRSSLYRSAITGQ